MVLAGNHKKGIGTIRRVKCGLHRDPCKPGVSPKGEEVKGHPPSICDLYLMTASFFVIRRGYRDQVLAAHVCYPSAQEAEIRRIKVRGQTQPQKYPIQKQG
jgi:hypothetical protein